MAKIKILDPATANQIAAGEVVERPASVIKELCENSIDSGATQINIEIFNGGISKMIVSDNGCGMDKEDLILAFEEHATSKIRSIDDLQKLSTKGFRGEALPSIASVSKVKARSKTAESDTAYEIEYEASEVLNISPISANVGTKIEVKDLFFNIPARYKFLKKDQAETEKIKELILRLALSHPSISFKLFSNGKLILQSPGNGKIEDAIYALLGKFYLNDLIKIPDADFDNNQEIKVYGYISQPDSYKRTRSGQYIFVNRRLVKSSTVNQALDQAYEHRLMKGQYPSCVLFIDLLPDLIDVNVHPQKLEIRFADSSKVFKKIYHLLDSVLKVYFRPPMNKKVEDITYTKKSNSDLFIYNSLLQADSKSFTHKNISDKQAAFSDKLYQNIDLNEDLIKADQDLFIEENANILAEIKKDSFSKIDKQETDLILSDIKVGESKLEYQIQKETYIRENYAQSKLAPLGVNVKLPLSAMKILGIAFDTFIILEDHELLWLIDQHAAHEKVLFEKFYNKYLKEKKFLKQNLLLPLDINLSSQEIALLYENLELAEEFGLEFDKFSENSIVLRTVPYLHSSYKDERILTDFIEFLTNKDHSAAIASSDKFYYELLSSVACKAAIKAGQKLSDMEIKSLLKDLDKLEYAYHCPHGRPLIIQMTKSELERRFKRLL